MDNNVFNSPMDIASRNSVVIDGVPNSLVGSSSFEFNNQSHQNPAMAGFQSVSALQEEPFGVIQTNLDITNNSRVFHSNELVTSLGRNAVRDASLGSSSSCLVPNNDFQDQLEEGTSISSTSLATLLAARSGLQENLHNLAMSVPSGYPSEVFRNHIAIDCSNDLNSSFKTSLSCGYEVLGNVNTKWDFEKSFTLPQFGGKTPLRVEFQPYPSIGNLQPNGWISTNDGDVTADCYGSSKYSNELSLSLAMSQTTVIGGRNIPNHCSAINCPAATYHCSDSTRLLSEQASCSSKELSLSFGSYGPAQFSQLISGSKYLHAIQEILAQIATYSLENLDEMSYITGKKRIRKNIPLSSCFTAERRLPINFDEFPNVDGSFEVRMDPLVQRKAVEAMKTQLLTLLQEVDDRYNQCLDEIHTVVSAFHAATELNPQVHACFALQTISFLYKSLRERISNQILSMGAYFQSEFTREKQTTPIDPFIREQWAFQQLKRKAHQIWRPQRGLPEKSVSVLRAWMFQNFLHPYPKDAEKHLLAVKSGLTRTQALTCLKIFCNVSNWFINARVRLWKPMIEEMYREVNRRKAQRNEEGNDSNDRSQTSLSNQRFNMN